MNQTRGGRASHAIADRQEKPDPTQVVLIALAAMLLTVRELAARASADYLPAAAPAPEPVVPVEKGWFPRLVSRFTKTATDIPAPPAPNLRQVAFETRIENRLKDFIAQSVLPEQGYDILAWLITPDKAARGLTALPSGFDAEAVACLELAWHEVLGIPFREFLSDGRIIAGEDVSNAGISPILSHVTPNRSADPLPIPATVRLPLKVLHSNTPIEHWEASGPVTKQNYASLWDELVKASSQLGRPQGGDMRRWLDDFDSMLSTVLYAVPAIINQEIAIDSLAESARFSAACAVGKWLHKQDGKLGEPDYLIVVGEFSPIQDFLFNIDRNNPWPSDAVLRGRSAFVKLTVELAALRILEQLELPSVSLSFCAASKFSMLVPNTGPVRDGLGKIQQDFDNWSLNGLHGTGRMLLRWRGAVPKAPDKSRTALVRSYQAALSDLDGAKYRRSELTREERLDVGRSPVLRRYLDEIELADGLCSLDGKSPGYRVLGKKQRELLPATNHSEPPLGRASSFQLMLANSLGHADLMEILNSDQYGLQSRQPESALSNFDFFGYKIRLITSNRNGATTKAVRSWDVSYAQRDRKYQKFNGNAIRLVGMHSPAVGDAADNIAVLKGDIDRLGAVFREGIPKASLVRISMLSKQLDLFFSLYVPALLRQQFPLVQTIVAGGDDFMFMGPVSDILSLTTKLHQQFSRFAANASMSFSAGISVSARQGSIQDLSALAEMALEAAKVNRNSICVHGRTVPWAAWSGLRQLEADLHHYFESLAVEFAYSEMDKRRRLLLRSVIQLIQDWNEPKDYGGLRWRPILHARLQAWCHTIRRKRADDGHDATSRNSRKHRERAVFEKLINLLDTRGFAVFGQDLLIPVGNLIMRERKELP